METYNYRTGTLNARVAAALDALDPSANVHTARNCMDGCPMNMGVDDALAMAAWHERNENPELAAVIRSAINMEKNTIIGYEVVASYRHTSYRAGDIHETQADALNAAKQLIQSSEHTPEGADALDDVAVYSVLEGEDSTGECLHTLYWEFDFHGDADKRTYALVVDGEVLS